MKITIEVYESKNGFEALYSTDVEKAYYVPITEEYHVGHGETEWLAIMDLSLKQHNKNTANNYITQPCPNCSKSLGAGLYKVGLCNWCGADIKLP